MPVARSGSLEDALLSRLTFHVVLASVLVAAWAALGLEGAARGAGLAAGLVGAAAPTIGAARVWPHPVRWGLVALGTLAVVLTLVLADG